jgi:hypothetical protein
MLLVFSSHLTSPAHACVQSTYCEHLWNHCQAIGRSIHLVNLGELLEQ